MAHKQGREMKPLPSVDLEIDKATPTGLIARSAMNEDRVMPVKNIGILAKNLPCENADSTLYSKDISESDRIDSANYSMSTGTPSLLEEMEKLSLQEHGTNKNELQKELQSIQETLDNRSSESSDDACVEVDSDGDTWLHLAVLFFRLDLVQHFLHTSPSMLNIANNLRQTALHLAVFLDCPDVVSLLMKRGAEILNYDLKGNTPLHLACRQGHLDCLKQLILPQDNTIKRALEHQNYDGYTCLHLAVAYGHTHVISYLLALGVDINVRDGCSGRTVLHHAAESGNTEFVTDLITHCRNSVDLDLRTYNGLSAIELASYRGYSEIVVALARGGAYLGDVININQHVFEDDFM